MLTSSQERRQHERPSGRGCPVPGSRHRDIICQTQTLAAQEPDATACSGLLLDSPAGHRFQASAAARARRWQARVVGSSSGK